MAPLFVGLVIKHDWAAGKFPIINSSNIYRTGKSMEIMELPSGKLT